jgi:hypothetical protein
MYTKPVFFLNFGSGGLRGCNTTTPSPPWVRLWPVRYVLSVQFDSYLSIIKSSVTVHWTVRHGN